MKRLISHGLLSLVLLASIIAFVACGAGEAPPQEPALEPGEQLSMAFNDMREARTAATTLGAFPNDMPNGAVQLASGPIQFSERVASAVHHPFNFDDAPTRSQLTLLLNSVTLDGHPVQEVTNLRPGLDVTAYNDAANYFAYIEAGLRLMGMPFPLINVGVDGPVVSTKIPLLYDRYFAVDMDSVMDDMDPFWLEMMQEMSSGLGSLDEWREHQKAMTEAIEYAFDFEAILLEILENLMEVSYVDAYVSEGNVYNLTVPAGYATAALGTLWDVLFDAYAMLDVSAFNGNFEAEWAEFLQEGREALDAIRFSQDLFLSIMLYQGVLMEIDIVGYMYADNGHDTPDEVRIHVAYNNISGDHVGDIAWVVEIEDMHPVWPSIGRFEFTSTLDTTDGHASNNSLYFMIHERQDIISINLNWYLTRTTDNRFYAGLKFNLTGECETGAFKDYVDVYLFAQGGTTFGENYFTVDLERLGLEILDNLISSNRFSVEILLSAFLRREIISPAALPTISPADQLFVMDASEDELDRIGQQIEGNVSGFRDMFELLGF